MYVRIGTSFQVGSHTILGHTITNREDNEPRMLFVHGGGASNKERLLPFAIELAEQGVASFAFDFSGHGESTGTLKESSLYRRALEATAALNYLQGPKPHVLCGYSMGGHICLELLKTNDIDTLVLFAPAIYDRDAFTVPFGAGFTDIIRKEGSWRRASVLDVLETFRGNLLIYIGESDDVIPKGVINLLDEHSWNVKTKEIIRIPDLGHRIPVWLAENPNKQKEIASRLLELLAMS
jgi:pimeloyl-ACP methyl ester carboxylesterase